MYVLFCVLFHCVVLCTVCAYMCTVLLPLCVNPTAVSKYIYHIKWQWVCNQRSKTDPLGQNNRMSHFHTILNVLGFTCSFRRRLLQYFVAKKETLLCQQQILARPRKYARPPPPPLVHITVTSDFVLLYVLSKHTSTESDNDSCI